MTGFAIIGYGEVGGIFAHDLAATGAPVAAFDTLPAAQARAAAAGHAAASAHAAIAMSDVVFVCVTAGSAPDAMRSLVGGLSHAPFVVDVNSIAPQTKQHDAAIIEAAGGRYVEAAVMASVPPKRLKTPMLLGGPHADAFIARMAPLAMDLTAYSPEIGRASSVKMCRSVMIKGIEALTIECMLAARHYGVEQDVLRTLGETLPHPDWPALARYVVSRALIHGKRRAEEMEEVVKTMQDAGVEPMASRAIVQRQDWAWRQGAAMGEDRNLAAIGPLMDALTAAMHLPKAAE
jgi:3-hydroxyisobutyrate dehydrogenase-like beta-hydroxyacid dehydrogenase